MIRTILVVCLCALSVMVSAQAEIFEGQFLGKSVPLFTLIDDPAIHTLATKKKHKEEWGEIPNFTQDNPITHPYQKTALPQNGDPLVRIQRNVNLYGEIDMDFIVEGNRQAEAGVLPGDPEADNGPNHFIHSTNGGGTLLRIFDTEGSLLEGPFSMNVFWQSLGVVGLGDPIIMYDQEFDRWVLTEFEGNDNNALLMAVSVTPDPLGEYYAYRFPTPFFPDYPKYGIWHDGYYVTTNEGASPFIPIYVIDRQKVLNGETPEIVRLPGMTKFFIGGVPVSQRATPAEWDGDLPPPPGSPHLSLRINDDSWNNQEDKIEIWEAYYDPTDPENSRLEGPIEIFIDAFDSNLCGETTRDCVCQPDTDLLVPVIPHVIQNRVQYRNFGDYEMLLLNFPVDINGENVAGIRWVEIRKYPGGEWEEYQEGTFAPDTQISRFMASIGMDDEGNIALVYTTVGKDSTYLGLRATGRLANDSLGVMTFKETSIVEGGSATPIGRWGDYSSISVDPVDGLSFWFTGQYMMSNETWATKVARFSIHKEANDLRPDRFTSNTIFPDFEAEEFVTVEIKNNGVDRFGNFDVSLEVDGNFIVTDAVPDSIGVNERLSHTFSVPVDLSAVRSYDFRVWTSQPDDLVRSNDTLDLNILHQARQDASLVNILNIAPLLCGDSLTIGIEVQNDGVDTIRSLDVALTLNGNTIEFSEDLDLATNEKDTLFRAIGGFDIGGNSLNIVVSNPNGMTDEIPTMDTLSYAFSYDPMSERLGLNLSSDFYATETSWSLETSDGEEILSEMYTSNGVKEDERIICVAEGCFVFTLKDSYGDGWSFGGDPDFEWRDDQGNILAKLISPSFGSQSVHEFCVPFECMINAEASGMDASGPGEMDGRISVDVFNAIPPLAYSIDGGETEQSGGLFQDVMPGDYTITVEDANGCVTTVDYSVGFVSSTGSSMNEQDILITPNPAGDFFQLIVRGYTGEDMTVARLQDNNGRILYDVEMIKKGSELIGTFTLKNRPSGLYFVTLDCQSCQTLYKVVKN